MLHLIASTRECSSATSTKYAFFGVIFWLKNCNSISVCPWYQQVINIFLPYTAIIGKNLWEEENNWQKKAPETTIIRKWRLGRERCIGNGNIITNRLAADKVWFASLISWCDGNRCKVSGKREFSQQRIKQPGSNRNHALPSPQCSVFFHFLLWAMELFHLCQ